MTHRVPKAARLAVSARNVRPAGVHPRDLAQPAVVDTARVDTASPRNEKAAKGPTSVQSDRRPRRCHTQRRFSSKEGTTPTPVAITFDQPADMPNSPTRMPRTTRLVTVLTAEAEQ